MKNLNLKQIVMFKITLFVLFLLLSSSYSFAQCSAHRNFKEIVNYLQQSQDNRYSVQITIINPGSNDKESRRYTAWGIASSDTEANKICSEGLKFIKEKVYFSDREHFDKNSPASQTFKFDVVKNNVLVTESMLGFANRASVVTNLIKKGRLIYGIDNRGRMFVFDFKKSRKFFGFFRSKKKK